MVSNVIIIDDLQYNCFNIYHHIIMNYTIDMLLGAIKNEYRIFKHLATKVNDDNKDHRIADNTRSAQELMEYIAFQSPAQINLGVLGGWDEAIYGHWVAKAQWYSYKDFADKIDEAIQYIESALRSLTEEQLSETISIWGMTMTRVEFFTSYFLVFLGAYKTQLFLILKSSGLSDLKTNNLRGGVDAA